MFVRERWLVVLNPALFARVKVIFEDLIIVPGFRYRYPDDNYSRRFLHAQNTFTTSYWRGSKSNKQAARKIITLGPMEYPTGLTLHRRHFGLQSCTSACLFT